MAGSVYTCRYCRQQSEFDAGSAPASCPHCGAPVEVTGAVSRSGWEKQPPISDMARIQFGQSSVQIEGKSVPTADFRLGGPERIYFSHHSVLWAEPSVQMSPMPMSGGWNRMRAGLPLVMLEAGGPGHIALSEDSPGEIVAIPLQHGQSVMVREHRFLAATSNVAYAWESPNVWITTGSGNDQETHFPLGAYVDVFGAQGAPGLLLLHSPGNTFIRDLAAGETICIQPSSLLYKDLSVGMQLHIEYPSVGGLQFTFGSGYSYRSLWLRMWGPGRVAVQSVFERSEESGQIISCSPATTTTW
ncbi:MAG TPA: AIM24 family protein [Acidimicrobiales bacterium]|nr:AIM24 family protein [Acidimicrobiales bacterium]